MKTTVVNTDKSRSSQSHKPVLNLLITLDLRNSNKHIALQALSIFYIWKNIRQQHQINKLKIIVPTWNDNFEIPEGPHSVSDIEDYIE